MFIKAQLLASRESEKEFLFFFNSQFYFFSLCLHISVIPIQINLLH